MVYVARTNVVVNERLIRRVMKLYGLRTKRDAIDFALRRVAGEESPHAALLELRGSGWDGDFEALRGHPLEP
jgi:Arc/MetJ family transcription regulator